MGVASSRTPASRQSRPPGRHQRTDAAVDVKAIDRYPVVALLGEGGMGSVYLVHDPDRDERVALKLLRKTADPTGLSTARFRREFGLLSSLRHPNLVSVYRFDEFEGVPYYTMEVVRGESVSQHPAFYKPVAADLWGEHRETAFHVLLQLLDAIEYIHLHGIVHRDLKPSNVLVTADGTLKVMDFGLARDTLQSEGGLTPPDLVVGTLEYCSPEQFSAPEHLDARSDLYSLGVMLYELVCGRSPYSRGSAIVTEILYGAPPDPRDVAPDVPPALRDLMLGLLEKDPAHRPSTVDEVRRLLTVLAAGLGVSVAARAAVDVPSERQASAFFVPRFITTPEVEARVDLFLGEVLAGSHRLLFVEGGTGTGKTRWLDEIRRLAQRRGLRVLKAGGDRSSVVPYSSIQTLLARDAAPPGGIDQRQGTDRFQETVSRHLHDLSSSQPVLLLVDDVQDVDPDSLELLLYLLRDLAWRPEENDHCGIGFACFMARDGGERLRHLTPHWHVALEEFDIHGMEAWLSSVLGDAECAALLIGRLHRGTGGNPHFALETLKAMAATGVLRFRNGRWMLDEPSDNEATVLPGSLKAIYQARLSPLSETARAVVATAALLGVEFAFDDLRRCCPDTDRLAEIADDLMARRILRAIGDRRLGRLAFPETQLRQHVLACMTATQEHEVRARIVRALEAAWDQGDRRVLHQLAYHSAALGAGVRASEYLLLAADAARLRFANEQASTLYEEALRVRGGDASSIPPEVRAAMASVLTAAGRFERAGELARGWALEAVDPVQRANWLEVLARCHMGQGRHDEALAVFTEALAALGVALPQRHPALGLSLLGNVLRQPLALWRGRAPRASDAGRRTLLRLLADLPNLFYFVRPPHREAFFFNAILHAVHLASSSAEPDLHAVIHATCGFMLCMAPRPPLRLIYGLLRPCADGLADMADVEAAVEVARFAGYGLYLLGDFDDAPITLRLGQTLSHRAANARGAAQCGTLYAISLWWKGPVADMEDAARQALHKCQAIEDATFVTFATEALAVALAYQGQDAESERLLDAALARYPADSDSADPMSLMFAQAWIAAVRREDDLALSRLESLKQRWERSATDHIHPERAGLLAAAAALRLLQQGRLPRDAAWEAKIDRWLCSARRLGSGIRYVAGHLDMVEAQRDALSGRLARAARRFEAGVTRVRSCGALMLELDGRTSFAQQLAARPEAEARRQAQRHVALATELAARLGAGCYAEHLRHLTDTLS